MQKLKGWAGGIFLAVGLVTGLAFLTRIIGGWGKWYSVDAHYALQVDSLLRGQLALSTEITNHPTDWVFGHGMHQLWGLGVPFLLVPFEAVGRLFGFPHFPIALLYLFITGTLLFYVHRQLPRWLEISETNISRAEFGLTALCLFFNGGILYLLSAHFSVYHQAIGFGFLGAMATVFLLLTIYHEPRSRAAYLFVGLAGFLPLVRPTLGAVSAVSVLVALPVLRQFSRKKKLGCAALLVVGRPCSLRRIGFASGPRSNLVTIWAFRRESKTYT